MLSLLKQWPATGTRSGRCWRPSAHRGPVLPGSGGDGGAERSLSRRRRTGGVLGRHHGAAALQGSGTTVPGLRVRHRCTQGRRRASRGRPEPVRTDGCGAGAVLARMRVPSRWRSTPNPPARMNELLQVLPEKQREILILRVVVGYERRGDRRRGRQHRGGGAGGPAPGAGQAEGGNHRDGARPCLTSAAGTPTAGIRR